MPPSLLQFDDDRLSATAFTPAMSFSHADYTVACICPMGIELAPVEAMLERTHPSLPTRRNQNSYILGEIGGHNMVVAVLPETGNNPAATVATQLLNDFPSIRFGLLVGIGGGVPNLENDIDIRLGDVVVSKPTKTTGGVVQYDMGKATFNGFERIGTLNKPPNVLRAAVQQLAARHEREDSQVSLYLSQMLKRFHKMNGKYSYPGAEHDQLFKAVYDHKGGSTCASCDSSQIVDRLARSNSNPSIHYGTIGSANRVLKNAIEREKLKADSDLMCVEMEAAGLMDSFPCLVIRGICDYADSHKNKKWQPYAAATAAAYMKELLSVMPPHEVTRPVNTNFNVVKLDEATMTSLHALHITDPEEDMKRIELSKDLLLEDCYRWILRDSNFQAWYRTDDSPLLWISGDPGKGKTMLMIALVHELSQNAIPNQDVVTFFFCQNTDIRLNSAVSILRGLIWKLAKDKPYLAKHVYEKHKYDKQPLGGPNAIVSLFSLLRTMLDDCPRAYLLIDALDECDSGLDRDQLLDLIKEHAMSSSNAKWLLASRNYPEIKQSLQSESRVVSLELNEQHISDAVCTFIEKKTSELAAKKGYDLLLKQKVKYALITQANSTFLWAALACKRLLKVRAGKALSTLEDLPPGLPELYARMLEQVLQIEDEGDKDYCLRILHAVGLAFRPLSMEELVTMANLPSEFLEDNELNQIIDLCGSFVVIRQNTLYFVHQSAKDYLVSDGGKKLFPAGFQQDHGLFVSRSLDAMSRTLRRDICNLKHPGSSASKAKIVTSLKTISYACSFWVEHLVNYLDDSTDTLCYIKYLEDRGSVHTFLLKHLLHWFEALSHIGEVDRGIAGLHSLERMIGNIPNRASDALFLTHKTLAYDAIRVFRQCRPAIEEAPLQVYCCALVFSPENSLVRQIFKQEAFRLISTFPRIPKDWSPCMQVLEGHISGVSSVTFSPNNQQLVSSSYDHTIRLWNTTTGACERVIKGYSVFSSVTFSPNGQLVSGSDDGTVRLWNTATGVCQQEFKGHMGWISSVAFSDDQQLASSSRDCTIRIWNITTGASKHILKAHAKFSFVKFSPSGRQLVTGSDDGTIRLYSTATGACEQVLEGHIHSVSSVVFSSSQRLLSGSIDGTIFLWDVATGSYERVLEGNTFSSMMFSPIGQYFVSGSDNGTVQLWNSTTGSCERMLEGHRGWVSSVIFSSDGQQLASGSDDGTVRLWDATTRSVEQIPDGHHGPVLSVAFSPGGQQLATGSRDSTIRLWDAVTGACEKVLKGHTAPVTSVTFSPDGYYLASGSDDGTVRLWNTFLRDCERLLRGHSGSVSSVTFSPDGQWLASGSHDGTVRLWDAVTGTLTRTLPFGGVSELIFSLDGRWLASSGRPIRLWDTATGLCEEVPEDCMDWDAFISDSSYFSTGLEIDIGNRWITWRGRKLLWLPPEYRPVSFAARENRIGISCNTGLVYILSFCTDGLRP